MSSYMYEMENIVPWQSTEMCCWDHRSHGQIPESPSQKYSAFIVLLPLQVTRLLTVKFLTWVSGIWLLTQQRVAWNPGLSSFIKYDKYVIPDSSSRNGEAKYSGSKTIGIWNSLLAISMAVRQLVTLQQETKIILLTLWLKQKWSRAST